MNNSNFDAAFNSLRPGDVISIKQPSHSMVILSKNENSITVVEGNYGEKVHWGKVLSKEELRSNLLLIESAYKKIRRSSKSTHSNFL